MSALLLTAAAIAVGILLERYRPGGQRDQATKVRIAIARLKIHQLVAQRPRR